MIKHIELPNAEGKILRGYLHMPDNFCGKLVVMFHGFTGNKTEHACHFRNFSRILEKEGVASLRLDFSGNAESDGTFLDFTFDTLLSDAKCIIEYAKKMDGVKSLNVLGFSMGGATAAIMSSIYYNDIDRLLLWSPAGNILSIIKAYYEKLPKDENGNALNGDFSMSLAMYKSIEKYNVFDNLSLYNNEVLIIQGKKDLSVPYETAEKYKSAFNKCNIHYIENAGHGYDPLAISGELYKTSLEYILK